MTTSSLCIGSRGSDLALWQARWVQGELQRRTPGLSVMIKIIKTTGDKILNAPLSRIGDKGLFTKEIESALLAGQIDLAVHSLKDLPTQLPGGLSIGAVCEREDIRDVFLPHPTNPVRTLRDQPQGVIVATGSLRRRSQVLAMRPDVQIVDIRGNLNTRLKKLDASDWSGMLLAYAGVHRLGWDDRIGEILDPGAILPAVGQGALGIEIRSKDRRTKELVAALNHEPTAQATSAERAFLRKLEGGCQVPIGTYARTDASQPDQLVLDGFVGSLDGKQMLRGSETGAAARGEELGTRLAGKLLAGGAAEILRAIRDNTRTVSQSIGA